MDLTEISDRIDLRLNTFNKGISVDEYEKSLYLTTAQKEMYYDLLKVFEVDGIITNILKPFVVEYTSTTLVVISGAVAGAQYMEIPQEVEKIIYDTAKLNVPLDPLLHNKITRVQAVKAAELVYKLDSPFREPNSTETLRVIVRKNDTNNLVELHAAGVIGQYDLKYFKTITPIILESLPTGLTIDGVSSATNTLFNDEMLDKIIERTVLSILQDNTVQKQNV